MSSFTPNRLLYLLFLIALMLAPAPTASAQRDVPATDKSDALSDLAVEDLTGLLTPTDLASALVGGGVTVSNVTFTGSPTAAGGFAGGAEVVGFADGFVLSTGAATQLIGPNETDRLATDFGLPGAADLTALAGHPTHDAVRLAFAFVPSNAEVAFNFVFASDEYNEHVHTPFNDVFAFYVNDTNCALIDGDPVSINSVNNGNPTGDATPVRPDLYINNDLDDGSGGIDTEMDGLTQVLTCTATVEPYEVNTVELALADASDGLVDSAVFVQADSVTTVPTDVALVSFGGAEAGPLPVPLALALAILGGGFVWRRLARQGAPR
jgi:hypothetical protein